MSSIHGYAFVVCFKHTVLESLQNVIKLQDYMYCAYASK